MVVEGGGGKYKATVFHPLNEDVQDHRTADVHSLLTIYPVGHPAIAVWCPKDAKNVCERACVRTCVHACVCVRASVCAFRGKGRKTLTMGTSLTRLGMLPTVTARLIGTFSEAIRECVLIKVRAK